jgi:hypothetical protein
VNVVKLESIFVVVILVGLLLQLPRLDDPPELRLVGGEIAKVEDIEGASLYVDMGSDGIVLVHVSELRMHEDPSGTAYVTKLVGLVATGGQPPRRLCLDATKRAEALGWRPVNELDGVVLPGNGSDRHAHEFRRLRLRRAVYEGRAVLLVASRVEGRDLVTGQVVAEDYNEGAVCPAIPFLERVNVSGVPGHCEDGGGRVSGAPGGRESVDCFWALTGTICWQRDRDGPSRSSLAWTAGYRYQ